MEEGLYKKRIGFKRKEVKGRLEDILGNRIEPSESARIASIFVDAAVDYADKKPQTYHDHIREKYFSLQEKVEEYIGHVKEIKNATFADRLGTLLVLTNVDDRTKESCLQFLKCLYLKLPEGEAKTVSEELLLLVRKGRNYLLLDAYRDIIKEISDIDYRYEHTLIKNLLGLDLADETGDKKMYFIRQISRLVHESKATGQHLNDPNYEVRLELPKLLLENIELTNVSLYIKTIAELKEKQGPDGYSFCYRAAEQIPNLLLNGADFKTIEDYVGYIREFDTKEKKYGEVVVEQLSNMFSKGMSKGIRDLYVSTVKKIGAECDDVAVAAAEGLPRLFEELNFDQSQKYIDFGLRILKNNNKVFTQSYFRLSEHNNTHWFAKELLKKGYSIDYVADAFGLAVKNVEGERK